MPPPALSVALCAVAGFTGTQEKAGEQPSTPHPVRKKHGPEGPLTLPVRLPTRPPTRCPECGPFGLMEHSITGIDLLISTQVDVFGASVKPGRKHTDYPLK